MASKPKTPQQAALKAQAAEKKAEREADRKRRGIVSKPRKKKPEGKTEREYQAELEARGQTNIFQRIRTIEIAEVTHGNRSAADAGGVSTTSEAKGAQASAEGIEAGCKGA